MNKDNQNKKNTVPKPRVERGVHDKEKNSQKHKAKQNLKNFVGNGDDFDDYEDFEEFEQFK